MDRCRAHAVMAALFLLSVVAGCTKHEVVVAPLPKVFVPESSQEQAQEMPLPPTRRIAPPQHDSEIDLVMREARQGDLDPLLAQQQLAMIAQNAPQPLADEARFRAVELQLEQDDPYADSAASALLAQSPDYALVPHLHFWLASWLMRRAEVGPALAHLAAVLEREDALPELRRRALGFALRLLHRESVDERVVSWLLARLPRLEGEMRQEAARAAALRTTQVLLAQLYAQGKLRAEAFAPYYLEVARLALMRGDHGFLAQVASWSEDDVPGSSEARMIRRWRSGASRPTRIGVLLPLSGRYARYGAQALRGIRMAVSRLRYGDQITLVVADSQGESSATIAGYQRLLDADCVAVIGPLVADDVQALAPHLRPDVPVVALTNQSELASLARPMFVHSVGPMVQADFLAGYLLRRFGDAADGARDQDAVPPQVAVIERDRADSRKSADLFTRRLQAHGVVVHRLTMGQAVDERARLIALRRDSDDGLLLDALDEELALFIAEQDLEPVIPPALRAIYLPVSGVDVVRMAGQLAYVGLNRVLLLGDSRWQDGHLLDDHGRYLETARISTLQDGGSSSWATVARDEEYRQLWGDRARTVLSDVAFDSLVMVATLSSSWGLQGFPLLRALRDPGGFPLATGRVVFDRDGIGHKRFSLLAVRRGALVTVPQDEE